MRQRELHWNTEMMSVLVVQIEIEKIPVEDEPEETDARGSQQDIPEFVPAPLLRIAQGCRGIVDCQQSSDAAEHTDDLEQVDLEIAAAAQAPGFLQAVEQEAQADQESDNHETDRMSPGAQAPGAVG